MTRKIGRLHPTEDEFAVFWVSALHFGVDILKFHVSVRLNAWVSSWFGLCCLGWIALTHGE